MTIANVYYKIFYNRWGCYSRLFPPFSVAGIKWWAGHIDEVDCEELPESDLFANVTLETYYFKTHIKQWKFCNFVMSIEVPY